MKYKITQLFVYPIKSLKGIILENATLSNKGITLDRHWMLTETDGRFITQREMPEIALFEIKIIAGAIVVSHKEAVDNITIAIREADGKGKQITAKIFGVDQKVAIETEEVNAWFSKCLGKSVYLVFIPKGAERQVKRDPNSLINFPDSQQYLVLGNSSLAKLNAKLEEPIPINRFRPNIVFEGGEAHIEDEWKKIKIGDNLFESLKSCARCKITTINSQTGQVGKEPLQTLSTYRRWDRKIWFGRYFNLKESTSFGISVGDEIEVLE